MKSLNSPYLTKVGDTYYPKGRPIIHSDTLWQEKTWEAYMMEDGRCYFGFLVSRQGGGTDIYEISVDEFNGIKAGKLTYDDLIRLTDHSSTRKPVSHPSDD
ncbi:hypothetical protein PsAD46_04460 [Pseudovibrio sp. Ad46]|uniref:hypothetical protein n=1 Tax=Pseudovibrio sp. Ad46 TaxID=989432 RepID=UPI0007AE7985|nr:hypothetical protein [Pseudovibrio sp. Ad46]KZK78981.1 hypothetical protein PsAD46_04460 [Pseudovibrio sp. Ad46]